MQYSCSPAGDALFIGNSMPIRDIDAYGGATPHLSGFGDEIKNPIGPPIAANRGASGIDGVLSTAAGFAFGLRSAVTLLVGDVSFLHDINGLNLLRTGTWESILASLGFLVLGIPAAWMRSFASLPLGQA